MGKRQDLIEEIYNHIIEARSALAMLHMDGYESSELNKLRDALSDACWHAEKVHVELMADPDGYVIPQ